MKITQIADDFARASTPEAARDAAFRAVRFYTTNSSRINGPLREGMPSAVLDSFRRAVDHGLQCRPDYGQPSGPLDRRVHFPEAMLQDIVQKGELHDPAFMSTTTQMLDPQALSARNTLMHVQATHGAKVSDLSPDPHIEEYLLQSGSTLSLERAQITPIHDEDDPLHGSADAVRAELWMRQKAPE